MNLVELIAQKGILIQEFADKINVSRQAIYSWSNKESKPKQAYKVRMSNTLNITIEELEKFLKQ